MSLRYYAALVTGMLAETMTAFGLFCWTSLQIQDIAVWSVMAYIAGILVILAKTKPKKRKLGEPQIITLNKEEWNKTGEENADNE